MFGLPLAYASAYTTLPTTTPTDNYPACSSLAEATGHVIGTPMTSPLSMTSPMMFRGSAIVAGTGGILTGGIHTASSCPAGGSVLHASTEQCDNGAANGGVVQSCGNGAYQHVNE